MKKFLKIGAMSLVAFFLISISANAKSVEEVGTTSHSIICNQSQVSNLALPDGAFQTMQGMSFRQRVRAYLSGAIYGSPMLKPLDLTKKLSDFDN